MATEFQRHGDRIAAGRSEPEPLAEGAGKSRPIGVMPRPGGDDTFTGRRLRADVTAHSALTTEMSTLLSPVTDDPSEALLTTETVDHDRGPADEAWRLIWPEIRFFLGCGALFLVAFALATGLWVVAPAVVLGWHSAAITSGSMEPGIRVGDVVVFSATPDEPIAEGSVIVFPDGRGSLITHRVVATLDDGSYATRGDNNIVNDSTSVSHESVRGVGRILVPYVGYPAVWTSAGTWYSLALMAVLFGALSFASRWAILPSFNPWSVER